LDKRLIPITGLIALVRGDGGWPDLLRAQGLQRFQLEVPLATSAGNTRVDALLYRVEPNLVLLSECKSGRNLDEDQIKRYIAADAEALRRAGAVPPALTRVADFEVRTLVVGLEEHRATIEAAIRRLDIDTPLLTIGRERVRLSGASAVAGLDDFDEQHQTGLPPARFRVDHQSDDEQLEAVLVPEIIAAQARAEDVVDVEILSQSLLPEWPVLSHSARRDFVRRAESLVRALAAGEFRGQFRFEPAIGTLRARLVIEVSPATKDPRGRTQAWQAQQRRAERALRRPRQPSIPGQLSIDDLAGGGGLVED
jgi:hypothetical protein